jgi:hypothetical protein
MTYVELIKHNGASMTEKALEQRARRMAGRKWTRLSKFREPMKDGYGARYWCDCHLFATIEDVIDYLGRN